MAAAIKSNKGLLIEDSFTSWRDFYTKPDKVFDKIIKALGVDLSVLKRKSIDYVYEGGVVEAERGVLQGIAVDPNTETVKELGTAMVQKDEMPPKVSPGD